jgi:hypothetical protein
MPFPIIGAPITLVRDATYHGLPSRDAVGVSGQTLLRVQRNGLKIANKI